MFSEVVFKVVSRFLGLLLFSGHSLWGVIDWFVLVWHEVSLHSQGLPGFNTEFASRAWLVKMNRFQLLPGYAS